MMVFLAVVVPMIIIFLGEFGARNEGLIEGDQKALYVLQAKTFFEYLLLGFSMIFVVVPEGVWLTLLFVIAKTHSNLCKE